MRVFYVVLLLGFVAGCGDSDTTTPPVQQQPDPAGYQYSQSSVARQLVPELTAAEFDQLIQDNTEFALALYQWQAERRDNVFFSPLSISLTMAMSYAGARQQTATEMASALRFRLPDSKLHSGLNKVLLHFDDVSAGEHPMSLQLNQVSWLEQTTTLLPAYLDQLALYYGAGVYQTDFIQQPEQARQAINQWVAEQTQDKINELLPEGSVSPDTRLALLNTIYFQANWAQPFAPESTEAAPFYQLSGSSEQVPMMRQTAIRAGYSEGAGYQAMRLPYANPNFSMLLLLPAEGNFNAFEQQLTTARLDAIRVELSEHLVDLEMPKFELNQQLNLTSALQDFGMQEAFQADVADFSGISDSMSLFIGGVVHQAVIAVDEFGTEAAAATGITFEVTSMPPLAELALNRPFIYLIEEHETGSIVFMGRVLVP